VQRPPTLQQEAVVGDLLRQGMLEGVGPLRASVGLMEELGRLQLRETAVQNPCGRLGDELQQRHGRVHADDGRGLQEPLGLRRQAVDARRQHGLHGGRESEIGR
jgi:hypothetical protein